MGLKSLTLQMVLPVCLHVPIQPSDNLPPPSPPSNATVRLILSDGRIRTFRRPLPASELMSSHPLHLVCRSDRFLIGQIVPPLSPTDLLLPGQSYLLLPAPFFASALSLASLATSLSSPGKRLMLPFEIEKTAEGRLRMRVSDERLGEEKEGIVCTTSELEREYRELVLRGRVWKPRLETIVESTKKKGGGGGRFSGRRRRKEKKSLSKS